jgi:hypothetical protein
MSEEGRWERFGGRWIFLPYRRRKESVREMLDRCREADEQRIEMGDQDEFLRRQSLPPLENWQAKRWR